MPTLYFMEQDAGGPATGVAYPNVRTCVGVTAALANGTLVGGHMTDAADIAPLTGRMLVHIGGTAIVRLYLTGGYSLSPVPIHGGTPQQHATAVAAALNNFHGQAYSFDTGTLGYLGALILLDQPDFLGNVRVQYKNWKKLHVTTAQLPGAHPYKPKPVAIITTGVERNPKRFNAHPDLTLHDLPLTAFTVFAV